MDRSAPEAGGPAAARPSAAAGHGARPVPRSTPLGHHAPPPPAGGRFFPCHRAGPRRSFPYLLDCKPAPVRDKAAPFFLSIERNLRPGLELRQRTRRALKALAAN